MLLDDVAADLPGLTIILAHPSVPWQDEAISIATHKANVYIDLALAENVIRAGQTAW
jgi:predicted TIM-barrel fold metal-dependent hydrolase